MCKRLMKFIEKTNFYQQINMGLEKAGQQSMRLLSSLIKLQKQ